MLVAKFSSIELLVEVDCFLSEISFCVLVAFMEFMSRWRLLVLVTQILELKR